MPKKNPTLSVILSKKMKVSPIYGKVSYVTLLERTVKENKINRRSISFKSPLNMAKAKEAEMRSLGAVLLIIAGIIVLDFLAWGGEENLMALRGTTPEGGLGVNQFTPDAFGAFNRGGGPALSKSAPSAPTARPAGISPAGGGGTLRLLPWRDTCSTTLCLIPGMSFEIERKGGYALAPRFSGREETSGGDFLSKLLREIMKPAGT